MIIDNELLNKYRAYQQCMMEIGSQPLKFQTWLKRYKLAMNNDK
jgi:hypothetical protein